MSQVSMSQREVNMKHRERNERTKVRKKEVRSGTRKNGGRKGGRQEGRQEGGGRDVPNIVLPPCRAQFLCTSARCQSFSCRRG